MPPASASSSSELVDADDTPHEPTDADYYALELGAGRPIVLLHDALGTHEVFEAAIEILVEDFRCVALDLPGHGNSRPLDRERTPDFAAFVAEIGGVIDDICAAPAVLVGHGSGATLAAALAADRPGRAAAVVCVAALPWAGETLGPELRADEDWLDEHLARRYAADFFRRNPGTTVDERNRIIGLDPDAVNSLLGLATAGADARAVIDGLRIPFEFVHGTKDTMVALRDVEALAAACERPVRILPGIGHGVPVEASDELARIIAELIP